MKQSEYLFKKAQLFIPGGVNSPVRAFNAVGGTPPFIESAQGAYITDADGQQYIDYVGSWGPMILGHNHPKVVQAVKQQVEQGMSFGAPTEVEIQLAEKICQLMPNIELVRMVNSGTEATMSAIRLARGVTGRDNIIKFAGGYHGHSDCLLVNAGSGAATFGVPSSPGVPADFTKHTFTPDYNDLEETIKIFEQHGESIACIIVEPAACNFGCALPHPAFLPGLRKLCDEYGSLLILDEVITGFRVALGGAQQYFNINPDITTLGKIIGGGLPVGAFGGKREIMQHLSPLGPVYQAGTLSGNPLAMIAGLTTLNELEAPDFYLNLEKMTQQLINGLNARAQAENVDLHTTQIGSLFGLRFGTNERSLTKFNKFFHGMLDKGIYFGPSAFESAFVSSQHGNNEIQATLAAAEHVFSTMKEPTLAMAKD